MTLRVGDRRRPSSMSAAMSSNNDLDRLRTQLYLGGLAAALALHLTLYAPGRSPAIGVLGVVLLVALAHAALRLRGAAPPAALEWTVLASLALSATVPLVPDMREFGKALPDMIASDSVWTQMIVALFAARVLMETNRVRRDAFLRAPLAQAPIGRRPPILARLFAPSRDGAPPSAPRSTTGAPLALAMRGLVSQQSTPAAAAAAVCLILGFYAVLPHLSQSARDPALAAIGAALAGSTTIHAAVLFIFFLVVAQIAEAAAQTRQEGALLERARGVLSECLATAQPSASDLLDALAELDRRSAPSHAMRAMRDAVEGGGALLRGAPSHALGAVRLREASRRFLRNLIAILPLLGFLGTIVGLSTTLASLPAALASGARPGEGFDFSAALDGLAIKFQTTLLGLLTSMISTALLAALERREAEIDAQCLLIVDAALASATALRS